MRKKHHNPNKIQRSNGGYSKEDIAKIKTNPVKYFEFLYPNLKLNDVQRETISQIASEKNRGVIISQTQSANQFVQFVARFVASNY